jgi:hypothetical protein
LSSHAGDASAEVIKAFEQVGPLSPQAIAGAVPAFSPSGEVVVISPVSRKQVAHERSVALAVNDP